MGVNTEAIVECLLDDNLKKDLLDQFCLAAAEELSDFRTWQFKYYHKPEALKSTRSYWCLGDETFDDVMARDGVVSFEMFDPNVSVSIGRFTSSLWTTMRESVFLREPRSQEVLRRLAHKFAKITGSSRVLYVPDNADELSLACDMVAEGSSFEEILAYVYSQAKPVPPPPLEGVDLYKRHRDTYRIFFIDEVP